MTAITGQSVYLRTTMTSKLLVLTLPAESRAVQVTVVVPMRNRLRDGGVHLTRTTPSVGRTAP